MDCVEGLEALKTTSHLGLFLLLCTTTHILSVNSWLCEYKDRQEHSIFSSSKMYFKCFFLQGLDSRHRLVDFAGRIFHWISLFQSGLHGLVDFPKLVLSLVSRWGKPNQIKCLTWVPDIFKISWLIGFLIIEQINRRMNKTYRPHEKMENCWCTAISGSSMSNSCLFTSGID